MPRRRFLETEGKSSSRVEKLRGSSTNRCIGVSAVIVAERGDCSSSAISPQNEPGPSEYERLSGQRHRRGSLGDDEELAAGPALSRQDGAGGHVDLDRERGDPRQLLLIARREERHASEPFHLARLVAPHSTG